LCTCIIRQANSRAGHAERATTAASDLRGHWVHGPAIAVTGLTVTYFPTLSPTWVQVVFVPIVKKDSDRVPVAEAVEKLAAALKGANIRYKVRH